MRTLVLLDDTNNPSGILTRKDLMGFSVEEKLQKSISRRESISLADEVFANRQLNSVASNGQMKHLSPNLNKVSPNSTTPIETVTSYRVV
jgi:hypothetical protein